MSCCLAFNIVVHWALKALSTVLLPQQLSERCNTLSYWWLCLRLNCFTIVHPPPSSAPVVLILDRLYLGWYIVSRLIQTSRCTRVVHWLPNEEGRIYTLTLSRAVGEEWGVRVCACCVWRWDWVWYGVCWCDMWIRCTFVDVLYSR